MWSYALKEYAKLPDEMSKANVQWQGSYGLLSRDKHGNRERYDLVQRTPTGYRYYFGVTEDGIHGPWKPLVGSEDE